MTFHRRSFLKTLAVAPIALVRPFPLLAALTTPADDLVNIYLVGLFFMEFQGNDLILVTPKFKHHEFCILGPNGLKPMPENVNLWDRLVPGSVTTFQPENLKFPASAINSAGGYLLDPSNPSKHKHRCTMVLPKPYNVTVGRCEPLSNFHPKTGKIGDYIKNGATNKKLGSVTRLQYQPLDNKPYSYGYFALHHPLTLGTVNAALRSGRNPCGNGFDLQMHDIPPNAGSLAVPNCPDLTQLKGFFESSVDAKIDAGINFHVDVASCPQFGIQG